MYHVLHANLLNFDKTLPYLTLALAPAKPPIFVLFGFI